LNPTATSQSSLFESQFSSLAASSLFRAALTMRFEFDWDPAKAESHRKKRRAGRHAVKPGNMKMANKSG
jgi:hypothetical protein